MFATLFAVFCQIMLTYIRYTYSNAHLYLAKFVVWNWNVTFFANIILFSLSHFRRLR